MDDDVADEIVARHWHPVVNVLRTGIYDDDLEAIREAELRRTARDPVIETISERMTTLQQHSESGTNGDEDP